MGWTSTGDPYAHVGDSTLGFDSEEAAKSFAERHGWDYVVCIICFLYAAKMNFLVFRSFSQLVLDFHAVVLTLSEFFLV